METNSYIANTAKDYDMTYSQVEKIYNTYLWDKIGFYTELENFIKNRANK